MRNNIKNKNIGKPPSNPNTHKSEKNSHSYTNTQRSARFKRVYENHREKSPKKSPHKNAEPLAQYVSPQQQRTAQESFDEERPSGVFFYSDDSSSSDEPYILHLDDDDNDNDDNLFDQPVKSFKGEKWSAPTGSQSSNSNPVMSQFSSAPLASWIPPTTPSSSSSSGSSSSSVKSGSSSLSATGGLNPHAPEFIPIASRPCGPLPALLSPPAWLNCHHQHRPDLNHHQPHRDPLVHLSEEIGQFVHWISLTPVEQQKRNECIGRLKSFFRNKAECDTTVFGSSASNLSLPHGDIDVVLFPRFQLPQRIDVVQKKEKRFIQSLGRSISKSKTGTVISVIPEARVPLVKFLEKQTGIPIDVSFNKKDGLFTTATTKELLDEFPLLRPLVLLLKYFLNQRSLNDPANGGLGSYALILLVSSFLQKFPQNFFYEQKYRDVLSSQPKVDVSTCKYNQGVAAFYEALKDDRAFLGELFVRFFLFYGFRFNSFKTGISIKGKGEYFEKYENARFPEELTLEDPNNAENNAAKACRRWPEITQVFRFCYFSLTSHLTAHKTQMATSLLSAVIMPDPYYECLRSESFSVLE